VTDKNVIDFVGRYGPWAIIAGASEGVGAAFARQSAERGLNVVLLARRQAVLDDVANELRGTFGVDVRVVAIDLADDDAMAPIAAATDDIDVGLLMYCAGADPNVRPFLSEPIETAVSMVQRNCVMPLRLCHHFAAPMVERGRGGIVLLSSGAGLVGAPNLVAYGATKAFDMVMAEALWAELNESGVDVLGLVLGLTDTPAQRRMMAQHGQLPSIESPVPGATPAETVAADAIANLANGPTWLAGEDVRVGIPYLGALPRNDAVRVMIDVAAASTGNASDG
jgi:uncharacterized protein